MKQEYKIIIEKLTSQPKKVSEVFSFYKKLKPGDLDKLIFKLHTEAFSHINCLECANCCSSISPIVSDRDIDRISQKLKIKPSLFTEKYLEIDNKFLYGFKNQPCPFLGYDKYCDIYDFRPKACKEYPHTDANQFKKLLNITKENIKYCPAVAWIIEETYKQISKK